MPNDNVVLERVYAVSREKVWEAITDPDQMRKWYFPMMEDFKPEVGFETEFDVVNEGKSWPHIWRVTEVVPGRKIGYEWRFGGPLNQIRRPLNCVVLFA